MSIYHGFCDCVNQVTCVETLLIRDERREAMYSGHAVDIALAEIPSAQPDLP